jgi:hypothetical protein
MIMMALRGVGVFGMVFHRNHTRVNKARVLSLGVSAR